MQAAAGGVADKEYTGREGVDELFDDADALVKDDWPVKAVRVLRRARRTAGAKARASGGGEVNAAQSEGAVNLDPRGAGSARCEAELVALLEDTVNDDIWALHGSSGGGSTVYLEKPKPGVKASTALIRYRAEQVVDHPPERRPALTPAPRRAPPRDVRGHV